MKSFTTQRQCFLVIKGCSLKSSRSASRIFVRYGACFHFNSSQVAELSYCDCPLLCIQAQKILCQLVESSGTTTERDLKRARDLVLEAVTSIRRKIDPDQPIALGDVESLQHEIESYLLNQTHARISDPELSDNSIETIMPETIMPEAIMPETESKAPRRNAKRSVRTRARKKEPQDIM
mmetsp:Transcript_39792/g.158263  ORF Transcript_39792/g.158263 Transcript_39792/m.158263 type:complete len:179 (-) Transcript_39792:126-662(-)